MSNNISSSPFAQPRPQECRRCWWLARPATSCPRNKTHREKKTPGADTHKREHGEMECENVCHKNSQSPSSHYPPVKALCLPWDVKMVKMSLPSSQIVSIQINHFPPISTCDSVFDFTAAGKSTWGSFRLVSKTSI